MITEMRIKVFEILDIRGWGEVETAAREPWDGPQRGLEITGGHKKEHGVPAGSSESTKHLLVLPSWNNHPGVRS